MSTTAPKLTPKHIASIKSMFMEYKGISEIAKAYKVSRTTINWHINSNNWLAERKLAESEVFTSFSDAKKTDFVKMTQSAVNIMSRSLTELASRHEPPTMQEALRAADILKTLDNILRLDDGKPTDIVANQDKPMDDTELKKRLNADPFFKKDEEEENDPKIN